MNGLPILLAVFLLANLLAALLRIVRGPTAADRMLAALLFGTTGVAILLLLAHATDGPPLVALIDVALVFALLAAVAGAAFAQRAWHRKEGETEHERS